MTEPVLGVDFGGVILDGIPYMDTEVSFSGTRYLETPALPDAFESLRVLNQNLFKDRVFIVSRYDPAYGPGRCLEWLAHHDFWNQTGIPESHYNGCAQRKEKAAICDMLGITHFVDDRAEILHSLIGVVPNLYLFGDDANDKRQFQDSLEHFHQVQTWQELMEKLLMKTAG